MGLFSPDRSYVRSNATYDRSYDRFYARSNPTNYHSNDRSKKKRNNRKKDMFSLQKNTCNKTYIPRSISDEDLYALSLYIRKNYVNLINSLLLLNLDHQLYIIISMSKQILEELNIIDLCYDKNERLYNEVVSLYNICFQLFIMKLDRLS